MDLQNHTEEFWFGLISDQLTGHITPENRLLLTEWLQLSEDNYIFYQEIEKAWTMASLPAEINKINQQAGYQLFLKRVKRHSVFKRRLFYAAVLIPFCLLSVFTTLYLSRYNDREDELSVKFTTPYGSKSVIELKDGSTIKLNAGSTLEVDKNFARKERRVKLNGEAFIEVTKNPGCPFIVETKTIEVQVLGTTFNIKAYEEDKNESVALIEGSLAVTSRQGNNCLLSQSEMVYIDKTSGEITPDNLSFGHSYSWTTNQLLFNGETFEEIIQILVRTYDVKINIHSESLVTERFRGDFTNNETIEQVLNIMSSNNKFTYTIRGNIIDIY